MASTVDLVAESVPELAPKTFRTMSMRERWVYVREVITVEPLIAAYVSAAYLCGPALLNLEFEKGCRVDAGYNDTVCEAVLTGNHANYTPQNEHIQGLIAQMHSWNQPIQSIVPFVMILFLGSYSDRHKLRKPFLLLPIFGELFAVVGCILSVVFMREWSLTTLGTLQTVVPSFFGGQTMIVVAVFAYIADVSSVEMRTLRIGVVQIVLNVCSPIVQSFSGVLFASIGYIGVLSLAGAVYLAGFLYGVFFIKESRQPVGLNDKKSFLMDVADPRHVVDTFSLLFKKNPGNNRLYIVILMTVLFISTGVGSGEISVFYLYVQSLFSWTPVAFSFFFTFNTLVHLKGSIIGLPLFTNVFKFTDYTIINISFLDKILSNIILAFAKTTTVLYIGTYVSLLTGIGMIGLRSLATKVVSEENLGKAQSLFGVCETLGAAFSAPIYNAGIYQHTLHTFPGAFFLLGVVLYGLCVGLIFWMFLGTKNKLSEKKKGIEKEQEKKDESVNGIQLTETQTTHI